MATSLLSRKFPGKERFVKKKIIIKSGKILRSHRPGWACTRLLKDCWCHGGDLFYFIKIDWKISTKFASHQLANFGCDAGKLIYHWFTCSTCILIHSSVNGYHGRAFCREKLTRSKKNYILKIYVQGTFVRSMHHKMVQNWSESWSKFYL